MAFRLTTADCIEAMASMDEASVDAIVTDPPYGIRFMGKAWDGADIEAQIEAAARVAEGRTFQTIWGRSGHGAGGEGLGGRADKAGQYDRSITASRAFQEWCAVWGRQAFRVLKPGGHMLVSGGTRTYHRMAAGLEDAGFEIRDCLAWLYGSGFPKSLDVSKAIDKARDDKPEAFVVAIWLRARLAESTLTISDVNRSLNLDQMARWWFTDRPDLCQTPTWEQWLALKELIGYGDDMDAQVWRLNGRKGTPGEAFTKREVVGVGTAGLGKNRPAHEGGYKPEYDVTAPHLDEAQRWQGWGTALKPAFEPIVLARKPLIGSVARNVQEFGTGALNIDGTRIDSGTTTTHSEGRRSSSPTRPGEKRAEDGGRVTPQNRPEFVGVEHFGRWPANVILDEEAAAMLDEQSGETTSGSRKAGSYGRLGGYGRYSTWDAGPMPAVDGDSGGASRFFYIPKADREERNRGTERNNHPTVKPVELMQWLVRLITPPGGTVLDPFTGSGSTGMAALREGFEFIGIEREPEYVEIARARILGDAPLFNEEATV